MNKLTAIVLLCSVCIAPVSVSQTPQNAKGKQVKKPVKPKSTGKKQVKAVPKVDDGRVIFAGSEGDVNFVSYLPKSRQFFCAGSDFNFRWWNSATKLELSVPTDADSTSVSPSPDGKTIAVATNDGDLQIVRLMDGRILTAIPSHDSPISTTFWLGNSNRAGGVTRDGHIRVYNVDTKDTTLDIDDTAADYAVSVLDGTYIVAGNSTGLKFYEVEHNELKGSYEFVCEEKLNIAGPLLATPDGKQVLVTYAAPPDDPNKNCDAPYLFDVTSRAVTIKFPEVTKAVLCATISPDMKYVAFGTAKYAYVFEIATQKRVYSYSTDIEVRSLAFNDDGKSLIIGQASGGMLQVPLNRKADSTAKVGGMRMSK